jgi:hypothetical protein
MAQGTRGRWVRAAIFGFGVATSTGLVGCMTDDKPKDSKATAAPKAGLPGTPTLPPGGAAANAKAQWQPGAGQFGGPGGNLQQNTGFASGGPARAGTNNLNTTVAGQNFNNFAPGAGGVMTAPAVPGTTPGGLQPAGGFGAGGPGGVAPLGGTANYPPPALDPTNMPPIPQGAANEFPNGVQPPSGLGPVAPSPLPPVSPSKNF